MDNIRNKYFKIIELYKDNDEMAINKMIDLFQEVADSYEHDIYDSIIQWIGLKGGEKTINYIEHLNTKLYDEDSLQILYDLKNKIEKRY